MNPYQAPNRGTQGRGVKVNFLGALLSLALGLCLTALSMAYAVGVHVRDIDSFLAATDEALVQTGILTEDDAQRFAQETIGYLTGRRATWLEAISVNGEAVPVPPEFTQHMAEVRQWVVAFRYVVPLMIAAVVLLVFLTLIGAAAMRTRTYSPRSYLLGAAIPVLLAGICFLWAAADFASFWEALHNVLIPGGVFAADAAIMQLFPLTLFSRYISPVALTFAYCLGLVLFVAIILSAVDRRVRRRRAARRQQPQYDPMEYR